MSFNQQISLFIASDENQQLDGSSVFRVNLDQVINLRNAKQARAAVFQASIPYTWVNISDFEGNNVMIITDSVYSQTYTLTFPDGIYGLTDMLQYINDSLLMMDPNYSASAVFTFSGIPSTGQVALSYPATMTPQPLYEWDAGNSADTIHTILGFNAGSYPPMAGEQKIYISQNRSDLNRDITNALISVSFATGSVVNSSNSTVMCSVVPPPNISTGQTILYLPTSLIWSKLNTNYIDSFEVRLLQNDGFTLLREGAPPPAAQENWQMVVVIEYIE